jgi:hypothetical protein
MALDVDNLKCRKFFNGTSQLIEEIVRFPEKSISSFSVLAPLVGDTLTAFCPPEVIHKMGNNVNYFINLAPHHDLLQSQT